MTTAVEARTDLAHCVIAVECRGFGEKFVQAVEIVFFCVGVVGAARDIGVHSAAHRIELLEGEGREGMRVDKRHVAGGHYGVFSSGSRSRAVGGGGGGEAEVGVAVALEGHGERGAGPDRSAGSEAAR